MRVYTRIYERGYTYHTEAPGLGEHRDQDGDAEGRAKLAQHLDGFGQLSAFHSAVGQQAALILTAFYPRPTDLFRSPPRFTPSPEGDILSSQEGALAP